ncbi:hypothetical protein ACP275_14G214600 [Erythranthe tilingii]
MWSAKVILSITTLVLLLSVKSYEATRLLDEEAEQLWMTRSQNILLPSLQRGRAVRPPSPNGCTWVPGSGGRPCTATITGRNFAGRHTITPPPAGDAYPEQMFRFGVAADSK